MEWAHYISYFFAGAFFTNAIPHWVSGLMGRAFPTPFSKPPGRGLSSSTVNVVWGFFNLVIGYVLVFRVGHFDLRALDQAVSLAGGALLLSIGTAYNFGKLYGGNISREAGATLS